MEKDLVSVIIPCYNHAQFIERCLLSVLNEKYPNKEIVIIDDGSKDNSVDIIQRFISEHQDSGVKISLYTQQNCGVVKTLNKLIDYANGEYIAIVASDDELANNGIEKRVNLLNNSNYKAIIGNASVVDYEGNILKKIAATQLFRAKLRNLRNPEKLYKELILQWCVVGPCLLLKKEVYDEIGKYNEEYTIEDRDFYLRLIENNLLMYTEDIVALYRVHDTNMSLSLAISKVRLECAKINLAHADKQKSIFFALFLRSYKIDKILLEKELKVLYLLFKILRYVFFGFVRFF